MTLSLSSKLKGALARVRSGWCQRVCSVDQEGAPCDPDSPTACKWCLVGALLFDKEAIRFLRRILGERTHYPSLALWQDEKSRTVTDVIELLEAGHAAALAKGL